MRAKSRQESAGSRENIQGMLPLDKVKLFSLHVTKTGISLAARNVPLVYSVALPCGLPWFNAPLKGHGWGNMGSLHNLHLCLVIWFTEETCQTRTVTKWQDVKTCTCPGESETGKWKKVHVLSMLQLICRVASWVWHSALAIINMWRNFAPSPQFLKEATALTAKVAFLPTKSFSAALKIDWRTH